jgi:uncharacterized protein (DUF1501 family)
MDRRNFLKISGAITAGITLGSNSSISVAGRGETSNRLVIILLQGGMDGLAAVPPIGDRSLFDQRPDLTEKEPFELNREFGLTRELPYFFELFSKGEASVIHACGFPYTKRSHFEGQNVIQSGVTNPFSEKTGWVGRALSKLALTGRSISVSKPLILRGYDDIETVYPARLDGANDLSLEFIEAMMNSDYQPLRDSLEKINASILNGSFYGGRNLSKLAFQAGKAMSRDTGPVVSFMELGGFDTHAKQGTSQSKLEKLDQLIRAYRDGLGNRWKNTLVLTITEFGRTAKMNGSQGTDHGYGSATLMAGGLLKSANVVADWPSLKTSKLFERRDLNVTIDNRSLWSAALNVVFGLEHLEIAEEIFFDKTITDLSSQIFV